MFGIFFFFGLSVSGINFILLQFPILQENLGLNLFIFLIINLLILYIYCILSSSPNNKLNDHFHDVKEALINIFIGLLLGEIIFYLIGLWPYGSVDNIILVLIFDTLSYSFILTSMYSMILFIFQYKDASPKYYDQKT